MSALVYFAQAFSGGPIKIGCSRAPARRVASLSANSPETLDLVATLPGGERVERALHDMFAADRLHGEWFADTPALARVIEAIIAPDLSDPLVRDVHDAIRAVEAKEAQRVTA